ncbi:MAG: hypothetical protein ACK53V_18670, partial [Planctomycetota bacterium]
TFSAITSFPGSRVFANLKGLTNRGCSVEGQKILSSNSTPIISQASPLSANSQAERKIVGSLQAAARTLRW